MLYQYIFSGSLPENDSTYVKREADDELYEALLQGRFCYVLNSRQSGKSSLRVRTMSRLSKAGVECASIDLSSINIQSATQENWYADLIVKLIDSFALDVDLKDWWEQNQLNSSLLRFGIFLEEILLKEIKENIVIFIDEIDSVLSLNFPTDDFFAFIRSCYNQRVDNPEYNRLTFCLLGVASPNNLIQDKNRTPFNIGQGISLKGFQLHEVEPLEKGLQEKFHNPQAVIREILEWTGGQPFLTQKLCQLMVEEFEKGDPISVEQVVRTRIIENWESQDEPEHFRTIQARILRDEQRAGYLLELYRQIRLTVEEPEIIADDTLEQSELQLSGLLIRRQGKLKIYNKIYAVIFDQNWIETQLKNLRPYSENFRFWMASGGTDESRLLRGKALEEAEKWASDKSLSYQDRQFLAASKEKEIEREIAAKEQEAALDREIKDREAAEERNQLLSEANNRAKQKIIKGSVVLFLTLLVASILGVLSVIQGDKAIKAQQDVVDAKNDVKKAQEQKEKAQNDLKEAKKQANLAKQEVKEARQQGEKAKNDLEKAQEQTRLAKQEAEEAEARVKNAGKEVKEAQKQGEEAKRQLASVEQLRGQAEANLKDAQRRENKFKNDAIIAENNYQTAKQLQQEAQNNLNKTNEQAKYLSLLSDLSGELQSKNKQNEADELRKNLGISYAIKENYELQQALILSGIALAYQHLEKPQDAKSAIQSSISLLEKLYVKNSPQQNEARVYILNLQGEFFKEQNNYTGAVKAYTEAFKIIQSSNTENNYFKQNTQILKTTTVESVHRELIDLLSTKSTQKTDLLNQVRESLKNYYYAELEDLLNEENWLIADEITFLIMVYTAKKEKEGMLDDKSIRDFPCSELQKIDRLWLKYSQDYFGFSVQKSIYERIVKEQREEPKAFQSFGEEIGWFSSNRGFNPITLLGLYGERDKSKIPKGYLPLGIHSDFYKNLRESMLSKFKPYQRSFYQYRSLPKVIDFRSRQSLEDDLTQRSEDDNKTSWTFSFSGLLLSSPLAKSCQL